MYKSVPYIYASYDIHNIQGSDYVIIIFSLSVLFGISRYYLQPVGLFYPFLLDSRYILIILQIYFVCWKIKKQMYIFQTLLHFKTNDENITDKRKMKTKQENSDEKNDKIPGSQSHSSNDLFLLKDFLLSLELETFERKL